MTWRSLRRLSIALAACAACSETNTRSESTTPASDAGAPSQLDASLPADVGTDDTPIPFPDTPPPLLSATKLFAVPPIVDGHIVPRSDSDPYELATALFSDYAIKVRTVRMPTTSNEAARYDPRDVLDFPVGTVLTKTFSLRNDRREGHASSGTRVIETRLLVRRTMGWEAFPYVWNLEQTEAVYAPGGRVLEIANIDDKGAPRRFSYLVPSKNQCEECHHVRETGSAGSMLTPIGPKARNLNIDVVRDGARENQLDRWARLGKLVGLPPASERPRAINAFDPATGSIEERARTYLDVNCAHCHRPEATVGATTQLFLDIGNAKPFNLGECKRPGSAGPDVGGTFDIVPGDHTASILWFRVHTEESGKMMPAIGRALEHIEGATLLATWIDAMPARACTP